MTTPFSGVRGAGRLFTWSIVGRTPLAATSIILIVHARELTGSYAGAGAVAAVNAVATATGAPVLGRLVDRRGQTRVLLASGLVSAGALIGAALLPHGASLGALLAIAAVAGIAQPPLGACVRALWPQLIADPARLQAAYSFEAAALELTYISGPLIGLAVAGIWSTGAAVATIGAVLLTGTIGFAAMPASCDWRPAPHDGSRRQVALRSAGLRTLVVTLALLGALFGAVEVAVAAFARVHDAQGATGPLLAIWGVGSMLGGFAVAKAGGLHGARPLVAMLLGLAAGHVLVALADGPILLGALLVVAGLLIAPSLAALYALVDVVAMPGTMTEAFAWLTTAIAVGIAGGAAVGGALADVSPAATFALAGATSLVAAAVVATRSSTLGGVGPCGSTTAAQTARATS